MEVLYTTIYFLCVFAIQNVLGDNKTLPPPSDKVTDYNQSLAYCFRFTWIGPKYDNSTPPGNVTCEEYLDKTRAVGIPCESPLVYTDDGSPPDIDYIWDHHKQVVLSRQSRGYVCARYSFSFNNELQNVTYMRTKVFAKGEGAVKRGCFKQIVNEHEVELCVCTSQPGPGKPCNSALINLISLRLVIAMAFLTVVNLPLRFYFT